MSKNKVRNALHVKKATKGSSNEISFSVLDAARESEEGGKNRPRDTSSTGKISLFTLGNKGKPHATPTKDREIIVSSDSTGKKVGKNTFHASDVPRRKESRMRRTIPLVVCLCVVLVGVVTVAQTVTRVNERSEHFRNQLREQIDLVVASDDVVVSFDEFVSKECSQDRFDDMTTTGKSSSYEELSASYEELEEKVEAEKETLLGAVEAIKDIQPSLSDNTDKEAAHQAIVAAQSRLNMIDAGTSLASETLIATKANEQALSGWMTLINADAAVREATDLSKTMSKENIEKSQEKTYEALSLLNDASELMQMAQDEYSRLDLSDYFAYIEKRQESQQAALSVDQAYLERDKETLQQENERYNTLEDEAAQLAENLGDGPAALVSNAYEKATENERESYLSERTNAGNADTFLLDYLGTAPE